MEDNASDSLKAKAIRYFPPIPFDRAQYRDEDNRIFFPSSRIRISSAGDIAKHRNNSIMVPPYSPYPLFSPDVVVVRARPLLPAGLTYSKLLPRPQAVYEP